MINYIVLGEKRDVTLAVLQAIRSFTDDGCMVIGSKHNRGLRWSSLCQQQQTIDFGGADDQRLVDMLQDLTRYTRHLVLIPVDCAAIRMANRIARRISVSTIAIPDTSTMNLLDDHWRFQRLCQQHGLPVTRSRLIGAESEPDFHALSAELGLPFIIRPVTHDTGAESVLVRCRRDLWKLPARGLLIAQSVVRGAEVGISLLADRGQITAFAFAGDVHMPAAQRATLKRHASTLCSKMAFHGAMHLRAQFDSAHSELVLLDCVPHFWPGLTTSILAGLNLVAESVRRSPHIGAPQEVVCATPAVGHPLAGRHWPRLRAPDEGGRLLRAMALDSYSLSLATAALTQRLWRTIRSRPVPALRPTLGPIADSLPTGRDVHAG